MKRVLLVFLTVQSDLIVCAQLDVGHTSVPQADAAYYHAACGVGFTHPAGADAPIYLNDSAQTEVQAMITAHGGMEAWRRAKAVSYTQCLVYGEALATEWWLSEETTEISSEKTYQYWPLFDGRLASDGKTTWTTNWKLDNPPGVNVNMFYQTVALPWLTQAHDAELRYEGHGTLPGDSTTAFIKVRMTHKQPSKHSPQGYHVLYIHPNTHLLSGVEYNITYGAFLDLIELPKGQLALGPFIHVIYEHTPVDGLIFPKRYDTFDPFGGISGRHVVYNVSLSGSFDESRLRMPETGVIDRSSSVRR